MIRIFFALIIALVIGLLLARLYRKEKTAAVVVAISSFALLCAVLALMLFQRLGPAPQGDLSFIDIQQLEIVAASNRTLILRAELVNKHNELALNGIDLNFRLRNCTNSPMTEVQSCVAIDEFNTHIKLLAASNEQSQIQTSHHLTEAQMSQFPSGSVWLGEFTLLSAQWNK